MWREGLTRLGFHRRESNWTGWIFSTRDGFRSSINQNPEAASRWSTLRLGFDCICRFGQSDHTIEVRDWIS